MAPKRQGTGETGSDYINRSDPDANWVQTALSGDGWLHSNGQRELRTGRDGDHETQRIISPVAMDNVGRGFVPDRWRYGLNDDDFGSQKVVSVSDRANAKQQCEAGGPSGRGAFAANRRTKAGQYRARSIRRTRPQALLRGLRGLMQHHKFRDPNDLKAAFPDLSKAAFSQRAALAAVGQPAPFKRVTTTNAADEPVERKR
jgi:hypothetical protein